MEAVLLSPSSPLPERACRTAASIDDLVNTLLPARTR
jgi:hypothetical protein